MKFKLDENTPWVLKKIIEAVGAHIVDSVYHEGLTGIEDQNLIDHCLQDHRILITLDTDFLNPVLYSKSSHFGIIVLRPQTQGKKAVRDLFEQFLKSFDLNDAQNKVIIVEPTNIRVVN